MKNTAIVFGATGLVGSFLVEEMLASGHYAEVITPVRRLYGANRPGERQLTFDFSNPDSSLFPQGEDVFVAIGTTRSKTPNLEQYHAIDVGIPVTVAELAATTKARSLVVVSAVDANEKSSNFYLKMKGEMECLVAEHFPAAYFVRPALLRGPRKEYRMMENAFRKYAWLLDRLMIGRFKRYKSITARDVARAMIYLSQLGHADHVVQAPELHLLAKSPAPSSLSDT
jgi:uncharacterized protein YbjT (DUF2867 family)